MQSSNELCRAIATAAVVATVMQNYGCATNSAALGYVAQPRIAAPADLSLQHPPTVRVREADAEERRRLAAYPGASERQAQEVAEVVGTLPFLVVLWPFMLAELDPRSMAARNARASALERERARIAKDLPPRLTEIIQQRFSAPQSIDSNDVLDIAFVADRERVQGRQCWYLHVEVKLESPAGVSYRDAIYIDPLARSADAPAAACVESVDASGVFVYADAIPSMLERRLPGLPWQPSNAPPTSPGVDASSVATSPFAVRGTTYTNRPGGPESAEQSLAIIVDEARSPLLMELRANPKADAGGELIFRRYSEYRFDSGLPVVGARIFGADEEVQRNVTTFELMPGRYLIYLGNDLTQIGHNKKWNYAFGTVELKAGHRYRTERVNCTFGALQDPLCANRSGWRILKIVDSGTGQTELSGGR